MKLVESRRDIAILCSILIISILSGLGLAFTIANVYFKPIITTKVSQPIKSISSFDQTLSSSSNPNSSSVASVVSSSVPSSSSSIVELQLPPQAPQPKTIVADKDYLGLKITNYLKKNGYNLGFVWSSDLNKAGHPTPIDSSIDKVSLDKMAGQPKNISEIVPIPTKCESKNRVQFPKYGTDAPVNYASFQDMYNSNNNKIIDINNPIMESQAEINRGNYLSVPIQRLLTKGVVHLPESPFPGQVGNSYIVGHTSNFPQVRSDFNFVFKAFERKSKVGDEFYIWDNDCRKLKFRVFEVANILAEDITTAYKNFGDKRVVTLQGSILDANYQPTRRWLTRGELVFD